MSSRKKRDSNLPAPYLKRLWLDPERIPDREAYPFCLPFLSDHFELRFERAITIIVGENGTGKSTLLEGIAELAGYDGAGGGKGYMTVDHSDALEAMGATSRTRCAQVGCRRSPKVGSSARRVSSRWRDISIGPPATSEKLDLTFSRILTVKVFCASSTSAAIARASTFSTSRNRRCRPYAKWSF
jgi:hypothetical protein